MATKSALYIVEERFKVVCGIGGDLSHYPLTSKDDIQFETDKDKSREFAEVFTPLHIVDQMLDCVPQMSKDTSNLDLCSGYGQFTIRMLRNLYLKHRGLNILKYLKEQHYFAELQLSSCFKLLWTFTTDINLYIGDALKLNKLPMNAKGIWYYVEDLDQWVNVTRLVKLLMVKELKVFQDLSGLKSLPESKLFVYPFEKEEKFVKIFSAMMDTVNKNCKEYKSAMKQIIQTKAGRQHLIQMVSEAASAVEQNWQNHATPEWVVREMVNLIPEVTTLKKILVLFNIEFLECLVKEKGISPSRIDFGYDSEAEGELAKAIYKVGIFSVDHCMEVFKASTVEASNKRGGYDVVFSNPPYQIEDGGHGASARPIYQDIVMHTIDNLNSQYICMITPSRWMVGGKGLEEYRTRMLADTRIKSIVDFPGERTIFPSVQITGGVSYFLWDRDYSGLCTFNGILRNLNEFDVLVRDNTSCQVLRRVLAKTSTFCDQNVLPRKPFGLATNFSDWVPEGTPGAVECVVIRKDRKFVAAGIPTDLNNSQHLWKVCCPEGAGGHQLPDKAGFKTIILNLFLIEPGVICTETYIVAGAFPTKKEAENYLEYMKSKFFRYMLSLRISAQHINTDKFAWVPNMPHYNKVWTDADMYQHFGLTKKEIEHIESTIKAIK